MGNLSENFSIHEFICKCCGTGSINDTLVRICQHIRNVVDIPIRVTSGYRCVKHNNEVGGTAGSYHTKGEAVDLYADCGALALFWVAKIFVPLQEDS